MNVEIIPVGALEVNCYVVWGDAQQALVIDPGDEADRIADRIAARRLPVAAYLITHGHIDHVSGLVDLQQRYPAPVSMHPDDAAWAFTPESCLPPWYPPSSRAPKSLREVRDGQAGEDAGLKYTVIETPGHSPGGVCFHFPRDHVVFTGDTLFRGSVGRSDLRAADPRALARSLARLALLPDDTQVYPGHGPSTTIGTEKRSNYFFR